jgi:hypothetical protein
MTFVGQTMASIIMPYQMIGMTGMNAQEQSHNMPMMNHSNHNMSSDISFVSDNDENSEVSNEDCCTQSCHCFAGCSTVAMFVMHFVNTPNIDLSSKILTHVQLAISHQPKSLYRPPILS